MDTSERFSIYAASRRVDEQEEVMATKLEQIKSAQQQAWPIGDYHRVANYLNLFSMSEALCDEIQVLPHHRVLDVATGTGNTAIAAKRRGFPHVTGVDYAPELVEIARERASVDRLEISFDVGDAEDLPYPDDTFDIVLSTCGVMLTPDQETAAIELLRVCRSGGRIGVTAWTPDSDIAQFNNTIASYVPPPPEAPSPLKWGAEDGLRDLFGYRVEIRTRERDLDVAVRSSREAVEMLMEYFGPAIKAKHQLEPEARDELIDELTSGFSRVARPVEQAFYLPGKYLEAIIVQ
jgi:SAM-dependent methyltransferase